MLCLQHTMIHTRIICILLSEPDGSGYDFGCMIQDSVHVMSATYNDGLKNNNMYILLSEPYGSGYDFGCMIQDSVHVVSAPDNAEYNNNVYIYYCLNQMDLGMTLVA